MFSISAEQLRWLSSFEKESQMLQFYILIWGQKSYIKKGDESRLEKILKKNPLVHFLKDIVILKNALVLAQ